MKKNTTAKKTRQARSSAQAKQIRKMATKQRLTVGLDLGDRTSHYCILDEAGNVVSRGSAVTSEPGLQAVFGKMPTSRVALEVGSHSPWVSRLLMASGHEVIVANARKVRLIAEARKKNDRLDAEQLARLARVDPALLAPIRHRGEEAQGDLAVVRARAALVEARTKLVNAARGLAKPFGKRLKKCDADQVGEGLAKGLGEQLERTLRPMLKAITEMTKQIDEYDAQIEQIAKRYPELKLLKQVYGVGTLVGLTYMLTVDDPQRFGKSREAGSYFGLNPAERDSGNQKPQLGISKEGDRLVRTLLVQAAHCNLRKGAPDSDLREWGLELSKRGGKNAKKRAVIAMARKLAVLLHRLWVRGEVYDPHYNRKAAAARAAKVKAKAAA
jgi:transposase